MGIERLANVGVERVVYIGECLRDDCLNKRLEGVSEETAVRGISFGQEDIFLGRPSTDEMDKICESALKTVDWGGNRKTGFFLESNRFFFSLLNRLHKRGLSVPEDLAVIGFDPIYAEISERNFAALQSLQCPVHVIKQDIKAIGEIAGEYITKQFKQKDNNSLRTLIPTQIF